MEQQQQQQQQQQEEDSVMMIFIGTLWQAFAMISVMTKGTSIDAAWWST
jgi:hypothetical protein